MQRERRDSSRLGMTATDDSAHSGYVSERLVWVDHHVGNDRPKPAAQAHTSLE